MARHCSRCLFLFELHRPEIQFTLALGKRFEESGVEKALLIALVPDVQEKYFNLKLLWVAVKLYTLQNKYLISL